LQITREIKPAVGHQIAGGQKQARGHDFQEGMSSRMDARVKPAQDG
jgi:hypothetical protein